MPVCLWWLLFKGPPLTPLTEGVTQKNWPLLQTGSVHYLQTSPWTTYGPVHGLVLLTPLWTTPQIKLEKKNKKKDFTYSLFNRNNRKKWVWENVTDLSSVSAASYIIEIPKCHISFVVAISMYERPGNLREASKSVLLSAHFLHHFVLPYSPAGLWTSPKLHSLLTGIWNINKLDRHKITSEITDGPEKENKWKWFIFICSYRSSTCMIPMLWDERERVKAGMSPQTHGRAGRTKWWRERRHKFLRLPRFSCKATAKKIANMSWSAMNTPPPPPNLVCLWQPCKIQYCDPGAISIR